MASLEVHSVPFRSMISREGMARSEELDDGDYRTLAAVRAELRGFAHFTEQVAQTAGLTPQQHQVLVALRAAADRELTIGQLAETLLLKPHSVS